MHSFYGRYQYANYYRMSDTSPQQRDLYTVKGVRLLLSSRGVGKKVSLSAIMLQARTHRKTTASLSPHPTKPNQTQPNPTKPNPKPPPPP